VWCDEPEEVNVYDFLSHAECRATPYGSYDLLAGRGHIVAVHSVKSVFPEIHGTG
jgi:hypothetical protein